MSPAKVVVIDGVEYVPKSCVTPKPKHYKSVDNPMICISSRGSARGFYIEDDECRYWDIKDAKGQVIAFVPK